jgi:hypothetical protein
LDSRIFLTNVRDKIALFGIILFGILSFVTVWIILIFGRAEAAVVVAMISQITTIVAILGTVFKGAPSPPTESKTTETTVSTISSNPPGVSAGISPPAVAVSSPTGGFLKGEADGLQTETETKVRT